MTSPIAPGDRVECIDARGTQLLKLGRVYTLLEIFESLGQIFWSVGERGSFPDERDGWFPWRFRPLRGRFDYLLRDIPAVGTEGPKELVPERRETHPSPAGRAPCATEAIRISNIDAGFRR